MMRFFQSLLILSIILGGYTSHATDLTLTVRQHIAAAGSQGDFDKEYDKQLARFRKKEPISQDPLVPQIYKDFERMSEFELTLNGQRLIYKNGQLFEYHESIKEPLTSETFPRIVLAIMANHIAKNHSEKIDMAAAQREAAILLLSRTQIFEAQISTDLFESYKKALAETQAEPTEFVEEDPRFSHFSFGEGTIDKTIISLEPDHIRLVSTRERLFKEDQSDLHFLAVGTRQLIYPLRTGFENLKEIYAVVTSDPTAEGDGEDWFLFPRGTKQNQLVAYDPIAAHGYLHIWKIQAITFLLKMMEKAKNLQLIKAN